MYNGVSHSSFFIPHSSFKKSPPCPPHHRRIFPGYNKKYRKSEQLSVFLYFRLSQLHSLKGTKKKEISIGNFLLLFRASCRIRTNDPEITNHVLWPTELKRRVGSYLHRAATTNYLCYVPVLEDSKGAGRARLPMLLTCESKPFKG